MDILSLRLTLDGTIRWHRWSDGQELLALLVDRETKAWVAWTPTGYYMASPGGEDLIGWHLNRGWNQTADFFPASRFRARFNRPDIVGLVLETLDEDAAIKQANEIAGREVETPLISHLPPIIRITAPAGGTHVSTGTVTVDYAVRSPSGQPIESIHVLLNGIVPRFAFSHIRSPWTLFSISAQTGLRPIRLMKTFRLFARALVQRAPKR